MSYAYYAQITVDKTKVGETDADFAILINGIYDGTSGGPDLRTVANGGRVQNTALGGASGALTVPADFVFCSDPTNPTGTKLDFEIEKYNAATGEIVAWVQCGVSTTININTYMVYGDAAVTTSQENVAGTWDSGFVMIQHLAEISGTHYDSTGNNHDSDVVSVIDQDAVGKIDGADEFDLLDKYVRIPDAAAWDLPNQRLTVEAWIYPHTNTPSVVMRAVNRPGTSTVCSFNLAVQATTGYVYAGMRINSSIWGEVFGIQATANAWQCLVFTWNGSTLELLRNAATQGTAGLSGTPTGQTQEVFIGAYSETLQAFDGLIDEVRISNVARSANYATSCYNNQSSPSTFYEVGGQQFIPLFTYYKKITIDHAKVPGDLTDFPFLFNTTNADLKTVANGGKIENTASGGASGSLTVPADLVFSPNQDGSDPYDFEVEKYDPATGELVAHVRIPSLSSSVDTVFYVVYGDSDVTTSQENVTGVWGANYKGVWHLGEGSNPYYDSTINNNDSTAGTYPTADPAGRIDGAQNFETSNDEYISIPDADSLDLTGLLTLEAWVKLESLPGGGNPDYYFVCSKKQQEDPPIVNYELMSHSLLSGKLHFQCYYDGAWRTATWETAPSIGVWYYVVGVHDGSNIKISVNGAAFVTGSATAALTANVGALTIGGQTTKIGLYHWDGLIDEVRISPVARSANYIQATYNNQSSPSTFYEVGVRQFVTPFVYYKKITIDHDKVPGDLTDFPFLFNATDADLKTVANGGKIENTASGGASGSLTVPADLVFSPNQDGSDPYDFEVEKYDPATGELVAHVRIPSVSSSEDTVFYLVYGDSGVTTSQENVTGAWDANFKGVWHLAESAGSYYDSTANNNDSTSVIVSNRAAVGQIGVCPDFNGTVDEVTLPDIAALDGVSKVTYEAWLNPDALADWKNVVTKNLDGNNRVYFQLSGAGYGGNDDLLLGVANGANTYGYTSLNLISAGAWHYVVLVFDGTLSGNSERLKAFVQGIQRALTFSGTIPATTPNTPGVKVGDSGGYWDGRIDEVRLSNTARSADYVQATYNNQSSPGTFYTLGEAELNWDDWAKHRQFSISAAADNGVSAGYTVRFHATGNDALDIYEDCLASGNDFRVVRKVGESYYELDRDLVTFSSSKVDVWFALQEAIAGGADDTSYWLFYSKADAGPPPADKTNVYELYDDFEDGDISDWSYCGPDANDYWGIESAAPLEGSYSMRWNGVDTGGRWYRYKAASDDVEIRAKGKVLAANSQAGVVVRHAAETSAHGKGYIVLAYEADVLQVLEANGASATSLHDYAYSIAPGDILTLILSIVGSSISAEWLNAAGESVHTWSGTDDTFATGGIALHAIGWDAARDALFDEIYVRKKVGTEPTVEAISEAAAQPYSFIM